MHSPATSSSLLNAIRTSRLAWQRNAVACGRHGLPKHSAATRFSSSDSSEHQNALDDATATPELGAVDAATPPPPPPPPAPIERAERGRRTKATTTAPPVETVDWPEDLDVLWTPSENAEVDPSDASALPPPHILDEALQNLLITLHPQTQNRSVYATPHGPAVEPTLALYCPIEGGEYIVDATVNELARRTGAEVLVLDAVQLAAGEWGEFGKSANMVRLPRNPLHFRASSNAPTHPSNMMEDDEGDYDDLPMPGNASMMLTVMSPMSPRGTVLATSKLSSNQPSKAKAFFDALVNMPAADVSKNGPIPRIIYVRDFPTLASTSATWYRPLMNAVRQRRRGPITSPSSPISNPMTIVFGICPPITPPEVISPPSSPNGQNLLSLLMSQRGGSGPATSAPRPSKTDWNEDEGAVKAREARLRRRLKKWEKGDPSLLDDVPSLSLQEEGEEGEAKRGGPSDMVLLPGGKTVPLPFPMGGNPSSSPRNSPESDNKSSFFRMSVLVPSVRSTADEEDCRVQRRREINELTMRMAVGAVGGALDATRAGSLVASLEANEEESAEADGLSSESQRSPLEQMWEEWGKRIELWMNVKHLADRAVGRVMADRVASVYSKKQSLEPTPIPWEAVSQAWSADKMATDARKSWMKEIISTEKIDQDENKVSTDEALPSVDELVERLKNDPELDTHEQRLLGSIVNPVNMPTSFRQVHLPTNTIDSVRTIVTLPLLHPEAFQHGILKEHSITGCLLFGPPGTGKTLVVRALAKEAGCRMLTISPSDVMDMYVGEGEKLVKAVFTLARKLSPCVVFLDEIDALLGARSTARESGSSIAHRGVITEFMQEMDGLKTNKDSTVIVIGATNRPFDLDDAVLRRLPRRLLVDLPGEREREEILKIMLRSEALDTDVDVKVLAKRTESFSGSDLKHLCVSAAVDAVKDHVQLPWLTTNKESKSETNEAAPELVKVEEETLATTDALLEISTESPVSEEQATSVDVSSAVIEAKEAFAEIEAEAEKAEKTLPAGSRVLSLRHFEKALKEITPSSSEATGTLSALRKWNEEFGEGRRDRKRKQIWGKGRFGFSDPGNAVEDDGRVLPAFPSASVEDRSAPTGS